MFHGRSRLVAPLLGLALLLSACPGQEPPDAPPARPTGLTAQPGDGEVRLAWDPGAEDDLARYTLYRGVGSGELAAVAEIPAGTESHADTGLVNGASYRYALDAVDEAGQRSPPTAEVSATPRAEAGDTLPPTVSATEPEDGSAGVAVNDDIVVTFTEAMDRARTEAAFGSEPAVACAFGWNAPSTRLVCRPSAGLAPETSYTVAIGIGAEDEAGNALEAPFSFDFATGATELPVCVLDAASRLGACVVAP